MNIDSSSLSQLKRYTAPHQDDLIDDVIALSGIINGTHLNDYSFIIAPLSKAYEGYLKDFFLKIHLIDQRQYSSDRFRVGKVLNPSLRYKRFSIFQKLTDISPDGEELAEQLWDAWKYGRNRIFHYFPGETKNISAKQASQLIKLISQAIGNAGRFLQDNQNHKY